MRNRASSTGICRTSQKAGRRPVSVHLLGAVLLGVMTIPAQGSPADGDPEGDQVVPGKVKTVVKVNQPASDRKEFVAFGTIANGDGELKNKAEFIAMEDRLYQEQKGAAKYVRAKGPIDGPSAAMDCGGITLWRLCGGYGGDDRHFSFVPDGFPMMKVGADTLARLIDWADCEKKLDPPYQKNDVVYWSASALSWSQSHVSLVREYSGLFGGDHVMIETKDNNQSIFNRTGWQLTRGIHGSEGSTGQPVKDDPLIEGYGPGRVYRLEKNLRVEWFYWTPNWTPDSKIGGGVNGIDLTGFWQKEGDPATRFEIEQRKESIEHPLTIRRENGPVVSRGGFENHQILHRQKLAAGEYAYLTIPGTYTKDRLEWTGEGGRMEVWVRATRTSKAIYQGTWYQRYSISETESELRPATGGKEYNLNYREWLTHTPKTAIARVEVDLATGQLSGELRYEYTKTGSMGPMDGARIVDPSRLGVDPKDFASKQGRNYLRPGHGLSFQRDLGFKPAGWPSKSDDFILVIDGNPTEEELRSGKFEYDHDNFAVLWRTDDPGEQPPGGTLASGGSAGGVTAGGGAPGGSSSSIEELLARGVPAVHVRSCDPGGGGADAPFAIDGATGRTLAVSAGQILSDNSQIGSRGGQLTLAVSLPGSGSVASRTLTIDVEPRTAFNRGNFIAGERRLQTFLKEGTVELTDRVESAYTVRLATPCVTLRKIGTRYRVHHDSLTGVTTVQVFAGRVECIPTNRALAKVTLGAGQQIAIGKNEAGQVTPIDPAAIPPAGGGSTTGPGVSGARVGAVGQAGHVLVHHQITTDGVEPGCFPVLSGDGNRIVFAPQLYPCPLQVINFDGTGRRTVMETKTPPGVLDISHDGETVMALHNSREVIVAAADGSSSRIVFQYYDPEMNIARLTGDGRRVFFFLNRPVTQPGTSEILPDGLWVVGADGGNLRNILTQSHLQTALGTVGEGGVAWNRGCLAVSHDGSRLVFGVVSYGQSNPGPKIFTVGGDGSGLRLITEGTRDNRGSVGSASITADGGRVAYMLVSWGKPPHVGVAPFGGGEVVVAGPGTRFPYPDGNLMGDPLTFTADGSWLLLGSAGKQVATDGSGSAWSLSATRAGAGKVLLNGGFLRGRADLAGRRFVYICGDERNPHQFKQLSQLATLEIDPRDLGSAPSLSEVGVDPGYLIPGKVSPAVSARVGTRGKLILVSGVAIENGKIDQNVCAPILQDDGKTAGDLAAGDGLFTASMWAERNAVIGPHTVRIDAEVVDGQRRRHATAVDAGPIMVTTEKPPEGPAGGAITTGGTGGPGGTATAGGGASPGGRPPRTGGPAQPGGSGFTAGATSPARPGTTNTAAAGMRLEAEHRRVSEGELVHVPVWIKHAVDVANINFEVYYDAGVVRPEGEVIQGNLLGKAIFSANPREQQRIRVGFAQTSGLTGTGTVAYLPMRAVGPPGSKTPLHLEVVAIDNPGGVPLSIERIDGSIEIVGPGGHVPGDCDGDGQITAADAMCALNISVGNMENDMKFDVNGDGRVTSGDARVILKTAVGISR